jgi:hypothetical protein
MARSIEQRIARLEALVEHLRKLANVKLKSCEHPICQQTGGYWQDGSECGYCNGIQLLVEGPKRNKKD